MCSSRKYPYSPHRRDWNFLGDVGFWNIQKYKETYEALPEFPEGWGGVEKKSLPRERYGYFLELHIPFFFFFFMIQRKLGCWSQKQKRKNQPITRPEVEHCHCFILPLLLATSIMQFSLDHKQQSHKQNQCSASDSVGLIFTRLYHSTLLIMTLTKTLLLVKTSLNSKA